jgi:hypothetical protein
VSIFRARGKQFNLAAMAVAALLNPHVRVFRTRARYGHAITYFFPGVWMDDAELSQLRADVESIARDRMEVLPSYGVFLPGRKPYERRIVTLLYGHTSPAPVAFSAMVHCPVRVDGKNLQAVELGLAISRPFAHGDAEPRTARLLDLYVAPLLHLFAYKLLRPLWIVTYTSKPKVVGALADAFGNAFPDYRLERSATEQEVGVARAVFEQWADEAGVPPQAEFDPRTFVVKSSLDGPAAVLRDGDFDSQPKYHVPAANELCRSRLDYARGDEFLLVVRLDLRMALRPILGRLQGLQ